MEELIPNWNDQHCNGTEIQRDIKTESLNCSFTKITVIFLSGCLLIPWRCTLKQDQSKFFKVLRKDLIKYLKMQTGFLHYSQSQMTAFICAYLTISWRMSDAWLLSKPQYHDLDVMTHSQKSGRRSSRVIYFAVEKSAEYGNIREKNNLILVKFCGKI